MGFLNILRKRRKERTRPTADKPVSGDETGPKNGRLVLAVAASFIAMAALGAIDYRLIRDPSIWGRAFGPSVPSRPGSSQPSDGTDVGAAVKKAPCQVPPQIDFYRKLTAVDEHPQTFPEHKGEARSGGQGNSREEGSVSLPEKENKHNTCSVVGGSPMGTEQTSSPKSVKLPRSKPGRKRYTVQVGAFTNPGIAKQWALKWKARGYMVSLRPVARPRTGVIYRLYLGSFSSEKQADELVKRLKSKEGISALRLAVHN